MRYSTRSARFAEGIDNGAAFNFMVCRRVGRHADWHIHRPIGVCFSFYVGRAPQDEARVSELEERWKKQNNTVIAVQTMAAKCVIHATCRKAGASPPGSARCWRRMSGNLSSRVERRFLEIEERLRKARVGKEAQPDKLIPTSYIDEKINNYEYYLNEAHKNAPCQGCKTLVESAIVGVRIFKLMDKNNLKREDITDEKIRRIKEQVKRELGS